MKDKINEKVVRECTCCKKNKNLNEFSNHKSGKYGKASQCKKCVSLRRRNKYTIIRNKKLTESVNAYLSGKRQCTACKESKNLNEFANHKSGKYGKASQCKKCVNSKRRNKYANDPLEYERMTKNSLKSLYGIDIDGYNKMVDKQNGKCLICKARSIDLEKRLAVDHCHETGKIRGLLCTRCNQGLGKFKDDIHLLEQAIEYLES